MSEPRLISPMLDNFEMGGPISDHDGVKCCPAMRKNSDEKYIVKIISVPASQTKMDALLLTGAYSDKSAALAYFKGLANGIADEKKVLDNLSQLEGFIPFEDCQIVPMENESGYDVYLLSPYRRTLERRMSKKPMTQLAAVNLGLDLCAALAVCRRSGYMCIDLKPSNIFVEGDNEYKIGDLGFIKLSSLKYASVPDMYRSCYTAPEVEDALASLNDTIDIYAVGLILYQIFNGGLLPFTGSNAPSEKFAAPALADSEMAEIILKACDPDPAARWSDPVKMGQALVNYMQKNGVNDTPLVIEEPVNVEEIVAAVDAQVTSAVSDETIVVDVANLSELTADEVISEAEVSDQNEAATNLTDATMRIEAVPLVTPTPEEIETTSVIDEISESDNDESVIPELENDPVPQQPELPADEQETEDSPVVAEAAPAEEEYDNLSFLDEMDISSEDALEGVSDDIAEILSQVEALTAHEIPDPVLAPEPIEIKIPEPIPVESNEEECADEVADDEAATELTDEPLADEITEEDMPYVPKKKRTGLIICIVLAILVALAAGAYFFYNLFYLQPIHMLNVNGSEDTLQVELSADIDESMLSVVCADTHGNSLTAPVVGGKAVFSGLLPDTAYTVTVTVDGFHELTGTTTKVYSTPVQTKVVQLNAVTGSEDGSVVLNFSVEGPDSAQWNVIYNAEGEAERITAFPSHMVTLTGLSVGKEYTFRVEPIDDIYLSGETEVKYVARNLVCAENLRVTSCLNGELTAQWNTPEEETVTEWIVRCYNENGYDETLTTADNTITFQNVDDTVANTVEVTAANMSVNQYVLVNANSVTVSDFTVDTTRTDILTLNWNVNRDIPEGGWTIRYTVDGIAAANAIMTNENSAQVPVIPNAEYEFTILDNSGNAVLGGPFSHTQLDAPSFDNYDVTESSMTARLCKTPAESDWTYADLEDEDYVNTFTAGQKVSMVMALSDNADDSEDAVLTTFAVYSEAGQLVNFSHESIVWDSMWNHNYCELDIPCIPADAGTYEVVVFFNGCKAGSQKFEITA